MKRMIFVSVVVLMTVAAAGSAFAAGQSLLSAADKVPANVPNVTSQDLVALDPGTGVTPDAEAAFCADQGCSCSGAGCRCTTSSGSYCSNSSDGQTCTSGPCSTGGGGRGVVFMAILD